MIDTTLITRSNIQQRALDKCKKHFRCGLGISMGVGKTRIAIKHMLFFNVTKALVVAPKRSIFESWKDELAKLKVEDKLLHKIEFVTYLSLNKKNPEYYDIVYLDECHNLKHSHDKFLRKFEGRILGLTGTPPNDVGEKAMMVNIYCPIIFNFSVDKAANSRILNDYKIYIHHLRLDDKKNIKKKNKKGGYWYTSELNDYAYHTERSYDGGMNKIFRMKSMMDYKTKEVYTKELLKRYGKKKGKQVIIFANTQDQADRISTYSYHSNNPSSKDNLEYFSDGRINTLSCVLQLSEGVTIPNLTSGIIMHAYGNNRKSAQRIGRLLRLNPNEVAHCHILCYVNTVDKSWVTKAIADFSPSKIHHVEVINNTPTRVVKHGDDINRFDSWPKFYKK